MYIIHERCELLLKKYLAPLMMTVLLSGCGQSLDYTHLEDTNTDITTTETTTSVIEDVTESTEYPVDSTTVIVATSIPPNDNVIVLTDTSVTTIATTTETTLVTTTNILSNYGDEKQLINLASSLYSVACEMYWNYYYGSPYPLDYDEYIEDNNGIIYFLVDDNNIQSIEDVYNHWNEIFSSKNSNDFDDRFYEKNGKVYINDGSRGANIFYIDTEITEIVSINDNEVTFNAVSHYVNPEDNSPMEDESHEFSIILEENSYHVGKFTLPY